MRIFRTLMIARMFARMMGRVPVRHLLYLYGRMKYEKPHRFAGQIRINTFFPPYPSPAFDRFCRAIIERRRVPHSTYLAVTDQCPCMCAHCSYAGRNGRSMTTTEMLSTIAQIKELGTATLGLTGGEPLLRNDLEELISAAVPEMACIVFTTGHGLSVQRARQLSSAGAICVTIGLEHADEATHDRVRAHRGSFAEAETAAKSCCEAGVYLAISTVGTREKLASGELERLYVLAERWGACEFRILTPVATGAWTGCGSVMLTPQELRAMADFHREHNRYDAGPAVASFAYLESDELFGCGAGFHHLYIDACGKVCPCDLTPLSFGDVNDEQLMDIWKRMGTMFAAPRRGCLMGELAAEVYKHAGALPLPPEVSTRLCDTCWAKGPLPEGYRRLIKPGERFNAPES